MFGWLRLRSVKAATQALKSYLLTILGDIFYHLHNDTLEGTQLSVAHELIWIVPVDYAHLYCAHRLPVRQFERDIRRLRLVKWSLWSVIRPKPFCAACRSAEGFVAHRFAIPLTLIECSFQDVFVFHAAFQRP